MLVDFFRRKPASSNVAKDRLKIVLVSDRASCSPEVMQQIKVEILNVLAKYLEIDMEGSDIKIAQTESDGGSEAVPALCASIPIKDISNKLAAQTVKK